MGKVYHGSVEAIAAEAGCSGEQVRLAVTAAFRSLHRTSVTDKQSVTAAIVDSYSLFGPEASYHLGGLLEEARVSNDSELPWSETMARFAPQSKPFAAVVEKWRQAGERPAE